MKLTDREYRILLAECASRIFAGKATTHPNHTPWVAQVAEDAKGILKACGIENEADSDPSLKVP